MKLHLPNSAHLQDIEVFIRKYSPDGTPTRLYVSETGDRSVVSRRWWRFEDGVVSTIESDGLLGPDASTGFACHA